MSSRPIPYLIFQEITGVPASADDFVRRIKQFSRGMLLRIIGIFNIIVTQWVDGHDESGQAWLVNQVFPRSLAMKILATRRPAFHRHQLLFIAQEALRQCDDANKHEPPMNDIGLIMLMASELLVVRRPKGTTQSQELARRISSVLGDMETNGPSGYQRKMARSIAMCTRVADELRSTKNFFDVRELFHAANGLELETFYALLFGCLSPFLQPKKIRRFSNLSDFGVPADFFRTCSAITSGELSAFLEYISADSNRYVAEIRRTNPHPNDFTVLKDRPMFADKGLYRPIDVHLLADKMESGIFWSVNGHLPPEKREHFHQFWGDVFELYATWLLSSSVNSDVNKLYPNPRYEKAQHGQVCDSILVSGRSAVFIEFKGSTFSANGKYGGDARVLDGELTKKLVGSRTSRKGVRQLVHAIQDLCGRGIPNAIDGLDVNDIDAVFPLIVTRDDIGSAFNSNAYLNFHFQELIKDIDLVRSVMPLCCISADDLERLTPYLADISLAEILSARIAGDGSLVTPLWHGENRVLDKLPGRPAKLLDAEVEKLEEMCRERLGLKDEEQSK